MTVPEVPASRAKNAFGDLLDTAMQVGAVTITRHDKPKAVLVSQEEFDALTGARDEPLDRLGDRLDGLLTRMQTSDAREARRAAFDASSDTLGDAALAEAAKRNER